MAWGPALLGAGAGLLSMFGGKGSSPKIKQTSNLSPEQQQYRDMVLNQLKETSPDMFNYINSILSDEDEAYQDFEAPYMEKYQNEIPRILERFRGGDTKYSSALNQSLAAGARGLSTDLAAQRANLKQNVMNNLMNLSQLGLNQTNTPYIKEGKQGVMDYAAPYMGKAIGDFASNKLLGPGGLFG